MLLCSAADVYFIETRFSPYSFMGVSKPGTEHITCTNPTSTLRSLGLPLTHRCSSAGLCFIVGFDGFAHSIVRCCVISVYFDDALIPFVHFPTGSRVFCARDKRGALMFTSCWLYNGSLYKRRVYMKAEHTVLHEMCLACAASFGRIHSLLVIVQLC